MSHKVVVFCPNPHSLYTTTVCEWLIREGIEVSAIVVRKFTIKRFISEYRRDGKRLLKKIWNKFVLREKSYQAETPYETIVKMRQRLGINAKHISYFAQYHQTQIVGCEELNDAIVAQTLKDLKPDLVVFTGGGIVRPTILEAAGAGVVNCHIGVLPPYRGMDVVEWPVLTKDFENIGLTVHFMEKGLDTGEILYVKRVQPNRSDTIKTLRERIEPMMSEALATTVIDFLAGKIQRQPQKIEDGKQFFVMHERLIEIANQNLKKLR
jgi:methionyl-tRNA formyltransferase